MKSEEVKRPVGRPPKTVEKEELPEIEIKGEETLGKSQFAKRIAEVNETYDNNQIFQQLVNEIEDIKANQKDIENWIIRFEAQFKETEKFANEKAVENRNMFLDDINAITMGMGKTTDIVTKFTEKLTEFWEWRDEKLPSLSDENQRLIEIANLGALSIQSIMMMQEEKLRPALQRLQEKIVGGFFQDYQ